MKIIPVRTTYLEMRHRPSGPISVPPINDCVITHVKKPQVSFYKFIYNSVGKEWLWVNRLLMGDEELKKIIWDKKVDIYVLYVNGTFAGYAELDRRIPNEIELAYFGLTLKFIGRGLGRYLLHWTVNKAWEYMPERLWVHTCELDHKTPLSNYLKAGFKIYKEEVIQQKLPD